MLFNQNICFRIFLILLAFVITQAITSEAHQADRSDKITTMENDREIIPIKIIDGHIYLDIKVNGRGPYLFLLDTGASGDGRIDLALKNELDLKVTGQTIIEDGNSRKAHIVDKVEVASIEIGSVTFKNLNVISRDYNKGSRLTQKKIKGIIGFNLFSDLLLTIDYPNSRLIIEKGYLKPEDANTSKYNCGENGLRCLVPITLGKLEIEVNLDTGNQGGFTLPGHYLKKVRKASRPQITGFAETVTGQYDLYEVELIDPILIGGHYISNYKAHFARHWRSPNIGYKILKQFSITFDQKNHLLKFTKS